jgi:hypothetical protein
VPQFKDRNEITAVDGIAACHRRDADNRAALAMHVNFDLAADGSLLTIRAAGYPDRDRFMAGLLENIGSHRCTEATGILCDFSELIIPLLPAWRVKQMVMSIRRTHDVCFPNPLAVVVFRPLDYVTVRTWDIHTRELFPVRNLFYTASKALAWLAAVKPGGAKPARVRGDSCAWPAAPGKPGKGNGPSLQSATRR